MILPFVLAVDFMNFTYPTNPCAKNVPVAVVMRGGTFSYFDKNMGTGFDLRVASVFEGSLRDGTRQAVVVLACRFPVGGTAAAYLFDERDGGAVLLTQVGGADWGLDWGSGPSSIRVRFARHLLYVDQCKDVSCAMNVVTTYALREGNVTKVFVQTRRRSP